MNDKHCFHSATFSALYLTFQTRVSNFTFLSFSLSQILLGSSEKPGKALVCFSDKGKEVFRIKMFIYFLLE